MNAIKKRDQLLVDTKTLQEMLSCCRATAVKIGEAAGARFQIGKVVRWKVDRIEAYLEEVQA